MNGSTDSLIQTGQQTITIAATSVSWTPYLSWGLLAALAVAVGALTLLGLVLGRRGTLWRLLLSGLILLALANPSVVREQRVPVPDILLLVKDQSPSQSQDDRLKQLDTAAEHIRAQVAANPGLELREITVPAAGGDQALTETRLFSALEKAIGDLPRRRIAGSILLTDGQVHDIPGDLANWQDIGPVHALITGNDAERDRRLKIVQAPSFGLLDKPVTVTIKVEDLPGAASNGQPVRVTARKNNEPQRQFTVTAGQPQDLTFTIDHNGPNVVELDAEPLDGEISDANNHAVIVVNGVRDRLRVLLVSGEPHPGERTWRNLLKADPSVDLVHFTILRPPEKQDGTPIRELSLIAFPIRELFEIKLKDFDLIIFDRYQRRGVLPPAYLENIANFVRDGGALLNAEGPSDATPLSLHNSPLGEVLPATPTGRVVTRAFRPEISLLGRRHPVTAGLDKGLDQDKPWGRWFRRIDSRPEAGTVLMTSEDNGPLLVVDRVGKGRVAQLLSDHVWLWDRGFDGGGPQAELLRRIAHWLMKEPELEEERLEAQVDNGRLTVSRHSLDTPPVTVKVTDPSGKETVLALTDKGDGLAQGSLEAGLPGLYRVEDGELSTVALSGHLNPPEYADLRSDTDKLAPIAAATGGVVRRLSAWPTPDLRLVHDRGQLAGRDWLGLRDNDNYRVIAVTDAPLLPPLLLLLAVMLLLLTGWWRESR